MLREDLEKFLTMKGEEAQEGQLNQFRTGDILRAISTAGDIFLFVVTNTISFRADVYKYDGKNRTLDNAFMGNYHISCVIGVGKIVELGETHTNIIDKLEKLNSQ